MSLKYLFIFVISFHFGYFDSMVVDVILAEILILMIASKLAEGISAGPMRLLYFISRNYAAHFLHRILSFLYSLRTYYYTSFRHTHFIGMPSFHAASHLLLSATYYRE